MADIKIYTTKVCPYCERAKQLFKSLGLAYDEVSVDQTGEQFAKLSADNNGWRTVPMIFIKGKFVGGYDNVAALHKDGKLLPLFSA